jgi:hypothetical protein
LARLGGVSEISIAQPDSLGKVRVHFILFQRKLKANEFGKFAFSDSPWLNASIFLPKRVKRSRKVLLDFDSINDLNIWLKIRLS